MAGLEEKDKEERKRREKEWSRSGGQDGVWQGQVMPAVPFQGGEL